jgi:hypothetical protein
LAVGVLGSYGRGTAGVGSDLFVYGLKEWQSLPQWNPRLAEALRHDTLWLGDPPP